MISAAIEIYHDDYKDGIEPCFELDFEINHAPRVGEKIYFPEALYQLDELELEYHSSKMLQVSEITNQMTLLPDGTVDNTVIITINLVR